MSYMTVERPSFFVIGIEVRTQNSPEGAMQDIPALWERFYKECILDKIPNKISSDVLGLYTDYEKDFTKPYTLVIGCMATSLETIPKGMVGKRVPSAKYAVFTAKFPFPQSIIQTWQEIWKAPLPRTYTGDFEYYGEKFAHPTSGEVDIYIAVK